MKEKIRLPELLAPAGNEEKLRAAFHFGADAVYFAGKRFGMRAAADNFDHAAYIRSLEYAQSLGKKCYLTLNTMPRTDEFAELERELDFLAENPPDAVIVADAGVFRACRKRLSGVPIHISTQGAAVNAESCLMWYELGAKRIVLARELSLAAIAEIRSRVPEELELEAFIHGAMCVSFSGRCFLSEYYTGRDANRGECTQPCRWSYRFCEEKRPDDILTCEVHPEGSYLFGSKDLCMIGHVKELIDSGLTSLKIEGRMKSAYYTAVTANAYRIALEAVRKGSEVPVQALLRELDSVSHREYDTGYFFASPQKDAKIAEKGGYIGEKSYIATVESYDPETHTAICRQKNKVSDKDPCEVISPGKTGRAFRAKELKNEAGEEIGSANHPQMIFSVKIPFRVFPGDLIRKATGENE